MILKNLTILDHSPIPEKFFKKALELCSDIDPDDTVFVGFSEYLETILWTGNKKFTQGLKSKGFEKAIDTTQLFKKLIEKG